MTAALPPVPAPPPAPRRVARAVGRAQAGVAYALVVLVGAGAFLYPFWLPQESAADAAHAQDAPMVAALVGLLAVVAVMLEVRRGSMNGSTVALMGVLAATSGLLMLLDLPGGGSGVFFLVILAGAAFGPRFGLLLGLTAYLVGAIVTGGIGPWTPFQMLALSWIGAGSGLVGRATRRLRPRAEVAILAAFSWCCVFAYGAVMNLWFWPFSRIEGPLYWQPGLGVGQTLEHYWRFYVTTSFAWDAAGGLANLIVVAAVGRPVLRTLRRFSSRLDPVIELAPAAPAEPRGA